EIAVARTRGVLHVAGGGSCTWWELACATFERAGLHPTVHRGTTAASNAPAPRPAFSVLGSTRSDAPVLPAWQDGLAAHLIAREVLASWSCSSPVPPGSSARTSSTTRSATTRSTS